MDVQRASEAAAVDATGAGAPRDGTAAPTGKQATPPAGKAAKPKRKGPRPKHVPQRMCVACRERDAKRTLTRIVRTPDGEVVIDATGKQNGRGAYLCDNPRCWEKAIRGGLLTRALNVTLPAEAIEVLRQRAASLRAAREAEPAAQAGPGDASAASAGS